MEKSNNQPHIILFSDPDDDCLTKQYFICVEQDLMLESSSIISAIFFALAAHYVFNLSYHPKTGILQICCYHAFACSQFILIIQQVMCGLSYGKRYWAYLQRLAPNDTLLTRPTLVVSVVLLSCAESQTQAD